MATIRRADVEYDQAEEAFIEGDLPFVPGTARAALSHPSFRIVWSGLFASSIGVSIIVVVIVIFGRLLCMMQSSTVT